MILRTWGAKHGVPFAALLELEQMLGLIGSEGSTAVQPEGEPGSEGRQQSLIRLEAADKGYMLFRNNVGGVKGSSLRYGLANESQRQNDVLKSADLIGWRRLEFPPGYVVPQQGLVIAQFVSVEAKEEVWSFDPHDEHCAAQKNWMDLVLADGGFACFATGPGKL